MNDELKLALEDERAAQRRYSQRVRDEARAPIKYEGPQNTQWTGDGRPKFPPAPLGYLLGRVALTHPNDMLGGRNDFYIGERHVELDGVEVFSWAAPVACTFYQGTAHHEWCDDVAVIRSFDHKPNGEIKTLAEDVIRDGVLEVPFEKRALSIPNPAPDARRRPLPRPRPSAPPAPQVVTPLAVPPQGTSAPDLERRPTVSTPAAEPLIRAEAVLRSRMEAPRGKSLRPVLSTLQPDQYELVSYPADQNLIVEGPPGTGKTIVATHRAAYLLNHEAGENATIGDVLIVGPTVGYSQHVRGVIGDLVEDNDRIHVLSTIELAVLLLGSKVPPKGPGSTTWRDCDWELGSMARAAASRLRAKSRHGIAAHEVYDYLRANGKPDLPLTHDKEWATYLVDLPNYPQALQVRAHAALISLIKWTITQHRSLSNVTHAIVDEAQDMTSLEWFLLESINAGTWTILGDHNQRRSDHTFDNWDRVLEMIDVSYDGVAFRQLDRGYRSTRPILEYANKLLPRPERKIRAFQKVGPIPVVMRTSSDDLGLAITSQLARLFEAYPSGTTAVISPNFETIRTLLRARGWQGQHGNVEVWSLNGKTVRVFGPNAARGLEFDAVVVVEPTDFPMNVGRQGPLYTSLTRANRELVVIHIKPLPDALRR
ncbi:AAA family ATPase [Microbacterium sp. LWS13-1.2]|uniref:AAA family ATPase n=1 Tax=Microbacterium sp. LWS13-1.2 TaxID=3135264 RepID=A0AAU6SFL8_9MICO